MASRDDRPGQASGSSSQEEYRKKKAPVPAVPPARGAAAPRPPTGAAGAARGGLLPGWGDKRRCVKRRLPRGAPLRAGGCVKLGGWGGREERRCVKSAALQEELGLMANANAMSAAA